MGIKKRSSEFRGRNRCRVLREHDDLVLETEKNIAYDNAIAAKDILHGYFAGEFDISEFDELVSEGVENAYTTEEANRLHQNRLTRTLKRYCMCEKRKPTFVQPKTLHIGGYDIKVKPDAVFFDKDYIELVIWRVGMPNISDRGRTKDGSTKSCLELYFLLLYGRSLVPAGKKMTIKASYYFLRKKTDRRDFLADMEFFSGDGGNVVTLSEDYKGGTKEATELDRQFAKELSDFYDGEECSGKDCESCLFRPACEYQKAPEPYEKKKLTSKKGKITPSDAQQKIIDFRKGVCRVNATAGSGKTECMTERGARMFEEGVNPREMLFITFTDAGALEMKDRITKKCLTRGLKISVNDIQAMTFNSFAYRIVKDKYQDCGFTKIPIVLDTVRDSAIVTQLLNEHVIPGLDYYSFGVDQATCRGALACAKKVFELIKTLDLKVETPQDKDAAKEAIGTALSESNWNRFYTANAIENLIDLYEDYDKRLKEDNLLQYADQEPMMNLILEKYPGYLEQYGYKHIVVDEFQDSNDVQIETIKKLINCSCFESLMVVGDDSQSIYGFRYTSNENIIHFFDKIGMKGEDLYLVENRRSTPEILDLANKVNDLNEEKVEKDMIATRGHGIQPVVRGFKKSDEEYQYIADEIEKKIKSGVLPEDIAFIGARRSESIKLASILSEKNIPWILKNPMYLKDNSRVQAATSLAKAFFQPESEILYFHYLIAKCDGNIFDEYTTDEIKAYVTEMRNQFENMNSLDMEAQRAIFHNYLEDIKGSDEIYEYYLSLIYANEDLPSELEYIQNFTYFGEKLDKKLDQSYAGVVLTTAHSSKGLEWPIVYCSVSNFDSSILHRGKQSYVEEKRRLLFVSMTRARDELYLTGTYYISGGTKEEPLYNQFLMELLKMKPDGKMHPMYLEENICIDAAVEVAKCFQENQMVYDDLSTLKEPEFESIVDFLNNADLSDYDDFKTALEMMHYDNTYDEFKGYITACKDLSTALVRVFSFDKLRKEEIEAQKRKKKRTRKIKKNDADADVNTSFIDLVINEDNGQVSFSFT